MTKKRGRGRPIEYPDCPLRTYWRLEKRRQRKKASNPANSTLVGGPSNEVEVEEN